MLEDQLLAELIALRAEVKEIVDKVASLEKENTTLSENQEIQLKLINQLHADTRKAPQPMQKRPGRYSESFACGQRRQDACQGHQEEDAYQEEPFCRTPESLRLCRD